ncbi:MAG: GNAT family N-acetyltransferase [Proteobacteria bacterium]|nr:GNAT family N-acetyltransferase [Pseudomonadota bacterium]
MSEPGETRPALPRELDRIAELWCALSGHHASFDPLYRLRPGAIDAVRELLRAQLRDPAHQIFVCDRGGDLLGFCIARIDRAPPIQEEELRAEITDVWVRPDARRGGVGRRLAEAAFAWVRAHSVARIEVRVAVENELGQAFWRGLGFGALMDVLHKRL